MDFELTEEQQTLQTAIRRFAEREVRPLAAQIDRDDAMPEELWHKLGEMGLLGIAVDEAYGGVSGDLWSFVIAGEEMSAVSTAIALSMGAHSNLCVHNIFRNGTDAQKLQYLPDLCAGKTIGALCITEPDHGSDAMAMETRAVRDGEHYVLQGTKTWITNGPIADIFVVYAKTNPSAGAFGISAFIVERAFGGIHTSTPFEKMGCRGSPTGRVSFDEVRVPVENLLGEENGGVAVVMSGLDIERVVFAALPLGQARRALELAVEYANERKQFGRPIADFQLIKAKIANMYVDLEAARLLVYKACDAACRMQRGGKGTQVHKLAAAALLFAAEAAERIAYDALQIHGGNGMSLEFEVNRIYRDVRLGTIGAGTSEIRRLIVGEAVLSEGK